MKINKDKTQALVTVLVTPCFYLKKTGYSSLKAILEYKRQRN
jgi:hypothetical protein